VQLAEEETADLIVLASHGQSEWGRIFSGSVAENVVRLSI
jgi:nucleotide-binding universal stress UspA family protein